jgi:hypothetical protein
MLIQFARAILNQELYRQSQSIVQAGEDFNACVSKPRRRVDAKKE